MSAFDVAELRRLSEAATPKKLERSANGVLCQVEDLHETDLLLLVDFTRGEENQEQEEMNAAFVAYAWNNRDRIVAQLEAADALAAVAEHAHTAMTYDVHENTKWLAARKLHESLAAYKKAKGA